MITSVLRELELWRVGMPTVKRTSYRIVRCCGQGRKNLSGGQLRRGGARRPRDAQKEPGPIFHVEYQRRPGRLEQPRGNGQLYVVQRCGHGIEPRWENKG